MKKGIGSQLNGMMIYHSSQNVSLTPALVVVATHGTALTGRVHTCKPVLVFFLMFYTHYNANIICSIGRFNVETRQYGLRSV